MPQDPGWPAHYPLERDSRISPQLALLLRLWPGEIEFTRKLSVGCGDTRSGIGRFSWYVVRRSGSEGSLNCLPQLRALELL